MQARTFRLPFKGSIEWAKEAGAFIDLTFAKIVAPDLTDPATSVTGDPRGQYIATASFDGVKEFIVSIRADPSINANNNGGLHGIKQNATLRTRLASMAKTIREIVTDAQETLGDVPGAGVQTYADDRMFRDCIRAFNMFHKKYPWDQFMSWSMVDLDGISGKIIEDTFQNLRDFEDIFAVFPENSTFEIPVLDRRRNPNVLKGTSAMFWTALPTIDPDYQWKRIQIIPPTTTGKVVISWRHYPRSFDTAGKILHVGMG